MPVAHTPAPHVRPAHRPAAAAESEKLPPSPKRRELVLNWPRIAYPDMTGRRAEGVQDNDVPYRREEEEKKKRAKIKD